MADQRVADIVEAMQRELSPELVTALTDLPITEVPVGLETEPDAEIEPYDPAHPDDPRGTDLDCATFDEPNGRDEDEGDEDERDEGNETDRATDAGDEGGPR
jgi:hypothetical protein